MPPFPAVTPLGMAYVPYQGWGEINSPERAFSSGTLFPELCFPFEEGGRR
ncbi:MAG: spore coat associated protein CotJA [Ruminococcus sp.]|nr:spore coat associated protein CotJA [Ruminococcus sp.]